MRIKTNNMINETQTKAKEAYVGVDIGSRNLKMIAIDSSGNTIYKSVGSYNEKEDRQNILQKRISELETEVNSRGYTIKKTVSTGSGGDLAKKEGINTHITEINANIISTRFSYPKIKTIIEIGGTDSKLIDVQTGLGKMNGMCAASTGTALESFANELKLSLDEFAKLALSSTSPTSIDAKCAVVSRTRAAAQLNNGESRANVSMGYVGAMVNCYLRTAQKIQPPVLFQGGVALNPAVVQSLKNKLGLDKNDFIVAEDPIFRVVYGAALYARDNEHQVTPKIASEKEDRLPLSVHKKRLQVYPKGKPIAWLGNTVPPEIAIACGYTPSWPGLEAIHTKKNSNGSDPLRIAGQKGFEEDCCSIQRALLGLSETNQIEAPKIIIGASSYCEFERDVFKHIAKSKEIPCFNLDIPLSGDYATKVNYLANQLRDLHSKVAQASGKSVDKEKFAESVDLSLKVLDRMADVNELRTRPGSPRVSREMFGFTFNLPTIRGTPQALDAVNTIYEYFSQKELDKKDDRPRILWDLLRDSRGETQNYTNSSLVFESVNFTWPKDHPKHGVNSIAESKDPYERLSRMILSNAAINSEERLEGMRTLKDRFGLDGVLMYQQPYCPLARGYIAQNFEKELGIPVYALSNDAITGSLDSITKTRVDSFLESFQKKSPQS